VKYILFTAKKIFYHTKSHHKHIVLIVKASKTIKKFDKYHFQTKI